jgi:hypothetical protein
MFAIIPIQINMEDQIVLQIIVVFMEHQLVIQMGHVPVQRDGKMME